MKLDIKQKNIYQDINCKHLDTKCLRLYNIIMKKVISVALITLLSINSTFVMADDVFRGHAEKTDTRIESHEKLFTGEVDTLDKKDVIEHTCLGISFILNTTELEKERGLINQKMADIEVLIRNLIHTNATRALDTDEFKRRYEEYVAESDAYNEKLKSIETQINDKKDRAVQLGQFVEYLKSNPGVLSDFSEEAWTATVEILKVDRDNKLIFAFKNGTEITV